MTKLFVECPERMSKGIGRVRDALKRHAPLSVEFVTHRAEADLIVHHVIGVQNYSDAPIDEVIRYDGKPYAMLQYCLKTTENGGNLNYWGPLWSGAEVVWSYYDLQATRGPWEFDFYYAPLGVDDAFHGVSRHNVSKLFTIGTSGFVAETEGVVEAAQAVSLTRGYQFHLGPDMQLGPRTAAQTGLSDAQVARRWAECQYVAGLRRVEGFELPAAEGLLCGARPVVFDKPHYREWYGDLAEYVPEDNKLTQSLVDLFQRPYREVTFAEILQARSLFSWDRLVSEFYRRIL